MNKRQDSRFDNCPVFCFWNELNARKESVVSVVVQYGTRLVQVFGRDFYFVLV